MLDHIDSEIRKNQDALFFIGTGAIEPGPSNTYGDLYKRLILIKNNTYIRDAGILYSLCNVFFNNDSEVTLKTNRDKTLSIVISAPAHKTYVGYTACEIDPYYVD